MKLGATRKDYESESKDWIMPFGKYKDQPISEINVNYIMTLLEKCDFLSDALRQSLEVEINKRKKELACFKKGYEKTSRTCARCPFLEECASFFNEYLDEEGYIVTQYL